MDYCLAEPNINLFILGDIKNFGFESPIQDVWYQTRQGKISGVALRHHDNLIIYSQKLNMDFQDVTQLLKIRKIRIISGKGIVLDRLLPFLQNSYIRREMQFCELANVENVLKETREVFVATEADAMEIAEAYGQIEEFTGLYASDVSQRYEQIINRIRSKEGIHMGFKVNGKIVSHANSAAETTVSGMLGGIMTLPEYRNRGLASKVVSALCKDLGQRGKSACLFHSNPNAGRIFNRLGFQDTNKWVIVENGLPMN